MALQLRKKHLKSKNMIEVKDINFKYSGQKTLVFDHFNLQLSENRIYGLLGKNGTG